MAEVADTIAPDAEEDVEVEEMVSEWRGMTYRQYQAAKSLSTKMARSDAASLSNPDENSKYVIFIAWRRFVDQRKEQALKMQQKAAKIRTPKKESPAAASSKNEREAQPLVLPQIKSPQARSPRHNRPKTSTVSCSPRLQLLSKPLKIYNHPPMPPLEGGFGSISPRKKKGYKKLQLNLVTNIYTAKNEIPQGFLTKLPIAARPVTKLVYEEEESRREYDSPRRGNSRQKLWAGRFHFLVRDAMQPVDLEVFLKDGLMISISASPPRSEWTSFCIITDFIPQELELGELDAGHGLLDRLELEMEDGPNNTTRAELLALPLQEAKKRRRAAVVLQARSRGHTIRKRNYERDTKAATSIQCGVRRRKARRVVRAEKDRLRAEREAREEQRRREQEEFRRQAEEKRRREKEREEARRKAGEEYARNLKLAQAEKQKAREERRRKAAAATKLQTKARQRQSKVRVKQLKADRKAQEEKKYDHAATKLQARQRARQCKKRVDTIKARRAAGIDAKAEQRAATLLTAAARGHKGRKSARKTKVEHYNSRGIMLAVGETMQGEGGWYQGDQSFYKWEVTPDQQWVKLHGPIDVDEYKTILAQEADEQAAAAKAKKPSKGRR